jgi:hypothetical protein
LCILQFCLALFSWIFSTLRVLVAVRLRWIKLLFVHRCLYLVKFVFFEKATKFDEISISLLTDKFLFFVSRYSFEYQPGSQSWNFIHWDQTNPSKVYLFLDTDKFVLSILLISNKKQLCRIKDQKSHWVVQLRVSGGTTQTA